MCQKQLLRLNLEKFFFSVYLHTNLRNNKGSQKFLSVIHYVIIFILNYPFSWSITTININNKWDRINDGWRYCFGTRILLKSTIDEYCNSNRPCFRIYGKPYNDGCSYVKLLHAVQVVQFQTTFTRIQTFNSN